MTDDPQHPDPIDPDRARPSATTSPRRNDRHDPADSVPATPRHRCTRPAASAPAAPAAGSYSPTPEPRPDWIAALRDARADLDPRALVRAGPAPVRRVGRGQSPQTRSGGRARIVAVALLSAVLASGGTVLALGATGALDRTAPAVPRPAQGTNVGAVQPVTIDESSATIDVAAKVSPAVVRITVTGNADAGDLGVIPETGVGSGVIYDSNGWILTNRHVVEGGDKFDVELKDGRVLSGTRLRHRHPDRPGHRQGRRRRTCRPPPSATSDALKVGQLVIAIGSPLGTYSNSVTSGIVSAKGRTITTDGSDGRSTTSSRPTRRSTRATPAARCSTPTATSSASTPRSPRTATASASRSRSTSPARSWSRPSPARSSPGRTSASASSASTASTPTRAQPAGQRGRARRRAHADGDTVDRGVKAGTPGRRRPGSRTATSSPGRRPGHRRRAPARRDPEPVLAGRHGRGRGPARRPDDHAEGDPRDAPRQPVTVRARTPRDIRAGVAFGPRRFSLPASVLAGRQIGRPRQISTPAWSSGPPSWTAGLRTRTTDLGHVEAR